MTAINVVVSPGRVEVYTDAAAVSATGKVARLGSKVRVLPGIGCVVAVRGIVQALDVLARMLPKVSSDFDALREAAADGRLRRACWWHPLAWLPFDLVVAGQTSNGPEVFMVCNHGRHPGVKPWTPIDIPFALIMPPVAMTKPMREQPGPNMPAILDRQREHLEPSLLLPRGRSIVGGYAECTTVSRVDITTREVRRWPDEIGKPIGGTVPRLALRKFAIGFACALAALFAGVTAWRAPAYAYVFQTYEGLPKSTVLTESGVFEVYDRPDLGLLITVPTLATLTGGFPDDLAHAEAARRWIASTGRPCTIEGTVELLKPDVEHRYRCG